MLDEDCNQGSIAPDEKRAERRREGYKKHAEETAVCPDCSPVDGWCRRHANVRFDEDDGVPW